MILLWGVVAAIGAAIAVAGVIVFLRWRVAGGLIAGFGALIAIGAVTFIASWLILGGRTLRSSSPSAFVDAFGYDPPVDVTNIEAEVSGWNDSVTRRLRFRAAPATIDAIAKRHRMAAVRTEECRELAIATACYHADPFDDHFASTSALLAYDPASRQAHFQYVGID